VDLTGVEDVKKTLRVLIEPLYNALLPFVNVYIIAPGGSNFSLSQSGSNRGGGCKKNLQPLLYGLLDRFESFYYVSLSFEYVHIFVYDSSVHVHTANSIKCRN
jgi:hypothetical protein